MFLLSNFYVHYFSGALLISLFKLLPLLVASLHQDFNDGVLIHTYTHTQTQSMRERNSPYLTKYLFIIKLFLDLFYNLLNYTY